MTGNIWMCSHLLDAEDLDFGKHEFITYKMGQQYYSMGEKRFANLVWRAGAVYKCGKQVLIRRDILEAYGFKRLTCAKLAKRKKCTR